MIENERVQTLVEFAVGDGHIQKYNSYHYKIEHSTKQRDYFNHKRDILLDLGFTGWERENQKVVKGKEYHTVSFCLHVDDDIKTAYKYVINKGRKAIDNKILRSFGARALAYWYMDDGTASKSCKSSSSPGNGIRYYYTYPKPKISSLKLYTYAFTVEENNLILKWLKNKFDINAFVYISKRDGPFIKISKREEREKFIDTVEPYVIPSMRYKVEGLQSYKGISPINVRQKRLSEEAPEKEDATVYG